MKVWAGALKNSLSLLLNVHAHAVSKFFVTPWTVAHQASPWNIHGMFQARILEWVAIYVSRGSSQPRD